MTLADDLEGLFVNSKGADIFSDKWISALADFRFYESLVFYTGVLMTIVLIGGI